MASRTPDFLFWARFRKKLTVMGMMGQTQGVSNATKPPSNPSRKILQIDFFGNVFHQLIREFFLLLSGCGRRIVLPAVVIDQFIGRILSKILF